jgi:hypothetical protein
VAAANIAELSQQWQGLKDALELIQQTQPQLAQHIMMQSHLPQAGPKLARDILFFLLALKNDDAAEWIGKKTTDALEQQSRGDMMRKLTSEFSTLRQLFMDSPNPQWQAAYTCVCTLRVGDVTRQDVGFGSGFAKAIGDAIEGATKEAVTDALKRALRTFGNPFGLALYDKSRENVGYDLPPFDAEGCLQRLLAAIPKRTTRAALEELWADEKDTRIDLKAADADRYAAFVAAFKAAGEKFQPTPEEKAA